MKIDKQSMVEMAELVAASVVTALKQEGVIGTTQKVGKSNKTAYAKTEQLLYNYNGFKRVVEEKKREIEDIRKYGVPQQCGAVGERVQSTPVQNGLVLPEESVERAVRNVEKSVQGTVQVISLIDKCLAALKSDPYYSILEMRYFEGRTLEDIGIKLNRDHTTISRNKSRLVKELSIRLFPDEAISEML